MKTNTSKLVAMAKRIEKAVELLERYAASCGDDHDIVERHARQFRVERDQVEEALREMEMQVITAAKNVAINFESGAFFELQDATKRGKSKRALNEISRDHARALKARRALGALQAEALTAPRV